MGTVETLIPTPVISDEKVRITGDSLDGHNHDVPSTAQLGIDHILRMIQIKTMRMSRPTLSSQERIAAQEDLKGYIEENIEILQGSLV